MHTVLCSRARTCVQIVAAHVAGLGEAAKVPVGSEFLGEVDTVPSTTPVTVAVALLLKKRRSAIGVVNQGKFVGALTSSHLRDAARLVLKGVLCGDSRRVWGAITALACWLWMLGCVPGWLRRASFLGQCVRPSLSGHGRGATNAVHQYRCTP